MSHIFVGFSVCECECLCICMLLTAEPRIEIENMSTNIYEHMYVVGVGAIVSATRRRPY